MKSLRDPDIIRIMNEEWSRRLLQLEEKISAAVTTKVGDDEKTVLAPELKVRHTKSGIRYTVDSVSTKDVILRTPEGETFVVDAQEMENAYEID